MDLLHGFNLGELIKRAIKCLVEGIMVALAAFLVPDKKRSLNLDEVALIALCAAATFSILDVFIPAMGSSARNGAGLTLGSTLVGGIRLVA